MSGNIRWPIAAAIAGALLVGTIIGPTVVQAATAGFVRLEGGGTSHLAKVSASGQLSVNAGLTETPAHQILAAEASPSSFVTAIGLATCTANGIYVVPKGDALILTGADFDNISANGTGAEQFAIMDGKAATPCTFDLAVAGSPASLETENQVFQPGIVIPSGDAIGLFGQNDDGAVQIYGYLVPASSVGQAATASHGRVSVKLPLTR
jgi:hypothetical protein